MLEILLEGVGVAKIDVAEEEEPLVGMLLEDEVELEDFYLLSTSRSPWLLIRVTFL